MVDCPDCGAPAYYNTDRKWCCSNSLCPLIEFHRSVGNCVHEITKKVYESQPKVIVSLTGGYHPIAHSRT